MRSTGAILSRRHATSTRLCFDRWLDKHNAGILLQIANRQHPYSVGALETKLRDVKTSLYDRRFNFRNQNRLNRLLMLMQLHANGLDSPRVYAQIIRACLLAHHGIDGKRHVILDEGGKSSLRMHG